MYAYYAVKASGRSPPKWVAKCITTVQLSQMFVGELIDFSYCRDLHSQNFIYTHGFLLDNTVTLSPCFAIGI